jgi:DNA-binding response OmpR family regulator
MENAGRKPTILVVEDDMDILAAIREDFELRGYDVVAAVNGCGAMLIAGKHSPDVIVLDLCLPEMDGEEFCRAAMQEYGYLPPVVMVSAGTDLKETCARLGLKYYLEKPFEPDALVAMIDAAWRAGPPQLRTERHSYAA